MNTSFEIPVALFLFKRVDKPLKILRRIKEIKPLTLYLLSDGGRDEEEKKLVNKCREEIEKEITWNCKVIKRYQDNNVGVYENIAGGAKFVFQFEKWCIFLEDDNLPELSFFKFCEDLLRYYENDTRILWICGTNYLIDCGTNCEASYFFTRNMLPCGWASWAEKFNKYYDKDLESWRNYKTKKNIFYTYVNKKLFYQDSLNLDIEVEHKKKFGKYYSWDYHMSLSLRVNNLLGIVPKYNQISNIGVDSFSTHGGSSLSNLMTSRFCELETRKISFPLMHPSSVLIDQEIEERLAQIILDPSIFSVKSKISLKIKKCLGLSLCDSLILSLRQKLSAILR